MHVEIKVAQNFVLNFLFNKLPRRRVNLFGEELDAAEGGERTRAA